MAVALAAGAIFLYVRHYDPRFPGGANEVFAAADQMPFRVIEARLSGISTHHPLQWIGAIRSSREQGPIETMRKIARRERVRGNEYAVGLAALLSGRVQEAIASLQTAAEKQAALDPGKQAATLCDLSAALATRAKGGDFGDALRAADLIEQAWQFQHSPAIAWNRALSREALFLRKPAIAAWRDYLRLDPGSAWSTEATAHVRRLREPTDSERWLLVRARLESGKTSIDAASVDAIVREFPQQSREFAEQELLGGDNESLRLATLIGGALSKSSGDHLILDSLAAAQRAPERHLAAHAAYVQGRAIVQSSPLEAMETLNRARQGFDALGSPFRYRVAVYDAYALYSAARLEEASREVHRTIAAIGDEAPRYPSVIAQLQWVTSLVEYSRGHTNEAMTACSAAAARFKRAQERENEAAMEAHIAATYRAVGQNHQADSHQQRALQLLSGVGQSRRAHAIFTEAALEIWKEGLPRVALLFQTEVVALAQASGDPVSICDAVTGHATYAAEAGERAIATRDLDVAAHQVPAIRDRAMRDRVGSNLLAAEAVVWRTFAPDRAAEAAKGAIAEMTRLGHRPGLVQIELEAGRALAKLHRDDDALLNWREGIAECERERLSLPPSEYRLTYFEQCRALFDESLDVLVRHQRFDDAYHLAEESRARGLLDAVAPSPAIEPVPERVPAGLTVVEYSVLPRAIVIWLIDASGITGQARAVRREDLKRRIDGLNTSRDESEFSARSAQLFEILLGHAAARLASRVVFIPDGDLYRVPFAALRETSGRFLAESHVISIAPSVAILTRSHNDRRIATPRAVLIDAGRVENGQLATLHEASREISAIRRLYPDATTIRGSSCTMTNVTNALRGATMAHFAGHALPGDAVIEPTLVLHPSGDNGGHLYARDIAALPLHTLRLVVLGGCATASGHIGSEGPLSIARAFLAAGAIRAIATLWKIDDDASMPLLVSFHRSLRGGFDAATALQETQIQAIRASIPARNWAAFEVLETVADVRQEQQARGGSIDE